MSRRNRKPASNGKAAQRRQAQSLLDANTEARSTEPAEPPRAVMAQIAETGERRPVRHFVLQPHAYQQIRAALGQLPYDRAAGIVQAFSAGTRAVFADEPPPLSAHTRESDPAAAVLEKAVRHELDELEGERLRGRIAGVHERLSAALKRYQATPAVEPSQEAQ